ncbi:hypothetical protein GJQ57_21065 [Ralstonia pickettii]|uniref:Pectate lyase superfamily protein domain-containing protein n=1 Tax=Ralstonia pickettii TaxID=329 RepID=A0A7X2HR94_RALPI|nr:hypothetical protein [Ralstonia pickettii]MRT01142.1 hypothetical protein [Ralstonia pickettii]
MTALIRGQVQYYADAITNVNVTGLADGAAIIGKGRNAVGDGGGGLFRYVASSSQAVDGGTVFAPAVGSGRIFRDGWTVLGFNGDLMVQDFGVVPGAFDAGTLAANDTALANARTWLAANTNAGKLKFPAGTYGYNTSPNWAINHARVLADGEVRLRCYGSGTGVILDAGSGSQNVYDVTFGTPGNPFIIEMAGTGAHACFVRAIHHSCIAIKPRSAGAGGAGILINFAVCTDFYFTCSVNEDGGWYGGAGGKPTYGINATQRGAGEQVSYCNFYNPIIEGVGTGIYLDYAIGNTFYSGTAEGCSTGGVFESANAARNRFIGMDMEVNTSYDVDSAGLATVIDGCDTNKLITFRGNDQTVRNGVHSQITITNAALFARLRDLRYNRLNNGSTVSDNGTQTTKDNVVNYVTGKIDAAQVPNVTNYGVAVSAPAAPSSGTAWQNTNTYPVEVIFSGGSISNIQYSRDNVTYYSVTGTTNGAAVRLAPGDWFKPTYTGSPNFVVVPM